MATGILTTVARSIAGGCDVIFDKNRATAAVANGDGFTCGGGERPWQMRVDAGQRLNVTLFQFSTRLSTADGLTAEDPPPAAAAAHRDCHVIGQIAEVQTNRKFVLCSSPNDARETHVYLSHSNLVDVTLNPNHVARFLLIVSGKTEGNNRESVRCVIHAMFLSGRCFE